MQAAYKGAGCAQRSLERILPERCAEFGDQIQSKPDAPVNTRAVRKHLPCPRHAEPPNLLRLKERPEPALLLYDGDPVLDSPCALCQECRPKLDIA
eukprot:267788-Pleurochrysis_carterae.AAC.1